MLSLVYICGSCEQPASAHTNDNNVVLDMGGGFTIECYREWDTIGFSSWWDGSVERFDYAIIDGVTTISLDPSGTEARSGSDLIMRRIAEDYDLWGLGADEAPYVSPLAPYSEQAKVDNWRDTTPNICTVTLEQHLTGLANEGVMEFLPAKRTVQTDEGPKTFVGKPAISIKPNASNVIDDSLRNAYVEGNDAFLSVKLLDEELTKKYHQHLLNIFLDKNTGDVRVGSIRIIKNTDGSITARCVNRNCTPSGKRASMTIFPDLATREDQEKFTWALVAHGNNHAAEWFKTREGYHKVHHMGCDITKCNPESVTCSHVTDQSVLTDAEQLAFLQDHARYCKDTNCKCSERIWELSVPEPVLVNTHSTGSAA